MVMPRYTKPWTCRSSITNYLGKLFLLVDSNPRTPRAVEGNGWAATADTLRFIRPHPVLMHPYLSPNLIQIRLRPLSNWAFVSIRVLGAKAGQPDPKFSVAFTSHHDVPRPTAESFHGDPTSRRRDGSEVDRLPCYLIYAIGASLRAE